MRLLRTGMRAFVNQSLTIIAAKRTRVRHHPAKGPVCRAFLLILTDFDPIA
jgi:hypothetical protein